jgi:predicted Zn-dependent peptidase
MERIPTLRSVTLGVWVNVGSRDEQIGQEGTSHFLEHMFFKGTRSRSASQISKEIDALGGEMNAFTTRETTTFYVKVLDQELPEAIKLLADLFHQSRFDAKELEKEKQVVLEEIRMVQDDAEDLVQDLHAAHILGKHPLGRPILGKPSIIRGLTRNDLVRYVQHHYDSQSTVIAVAGNFEMAPTIKLLNTAFGRGPKGPVQSMRRVPPSIHSGLVVKQKKLEQVHVCFGLPGVTAADPQRYAAHLANAVLGGSVSSRLFQEIREKRGLAYSIYSYLSTFSDVGLLTVYAATRAQEVVRVVDLVRRELKRMSRQGVEVEELARAKNQLKGGLMLGLESSHSRMSKLAKDEFHYGRHSSLAEIAESVDRISCDEVSAACERIFNCKNLGISVLGPVSGHALASIA